MKNRRQDKILELIEKFDIETQEELSERLQNVGFNVTQATVSRDIKQLRLIKILSEKGIYKYAVSEKSSQAVSVRFGSIFVECAKEIDIAQNLVVVKCHSGMANAVCAAVDSLADKRIVGTIAGDDTIFIAMKNEITAKDLCASLKNLLKGV